MLKKDKRSIALAQMYVLLLFVTNCSAEWWWLPWDKGSVLFTNDIEGEVLDHHCKSMHDDFGFQKLPYKVAQVYRFHIYSTYIKCNFWWGKMSGYGDGYEMFKNGEWGNHLGWAIRKEGIYRFEMTYKRWVLMYHWDQK